MTPAEEARRKENWERLKVEIPEAADFVKELYALGMVDGARCVAYVGPAADAPKPNPAKTITAAEMDLESFSAMRGRLKKEKDHGNR